MALYRKIIPKIARDVIRTLCSKNAIEVEEDRMGEAELDLAAVIVGHLDAEEEISRETADTLVRLGMPKDRFAQMKQRFAERRGVKIGEDGLEFLIGQFWRKLCLLQKILKRFLLTTKNLKKLLTNASPKH